jgi:hypothetical protein
MSIVTTTTANRLTGLASALLIALATGCAARPDIRSDRAPAVDLHGYKTFAFYEPVFPARAAYSSLAMQHLKEATREEMEKQHYVYDERNPDLRVNLLLMVVERQDFRTSPGGAVGPHGRVIGSNVETVRERQGTLMIDIVDAKKQQLVWQGVAEGKVGDDAVKDPGPALDRVVSEIFDAYPDA